LQTLDTLPCPVLVTDRYGRITDVNTSLLDLVGADSQRWCGQPMEGMLPVPSRIFLQTHLLPMVLHDGHLDEIKMEVVDRHGVRTPVLVNCKRTVNEDHESYHWVLFVSRERSRFEGELLEARNRAEANARALAERESALTALSSELLLAQEKVRLATESGGIGIWESDLITGAVHWDAQSYRLFGLEPKKEALTYDFWAAQVHPDDLDAAEAAFQLTLSTGADFFSEFRAVWADGSVHHLRGFGRLRRNADGRAERIVGTNIDVTETIQRAQSLKDARDSADAASQSKGQFLANMSHEIRTPMNAILGLLDLLQSTDLTDRQRDYASKTDGAARSLLGLLNDILDFSKVEAGKMTLESEPFRIDKLLRNLATILSSNVGAKDIEVLFDIDATLPTFLRGDAMRLQQVLINLGGNAVKFTSQGQVVLAMHMLSRQENSVSVRFSVQDTGIGIAPEHQAHIFSGFSQAEGSTTRRFGGTGLGLAISKRFVELMGGDIEITSAPGVGSTFAFVLEMPTEELVPEHLAEPDRSSVAPQRVLVVDDNPIAGELTLRMIRSWGWTAHLAQSGQQALEMIATQRNPAETAFPYPVVYMDWKMPDMDGWEATRRIREWAQTLNLPQPLVMMITAHGGETLALRTEAEQDMINGFLVKPVTASMLYDALKDASSGNTSVRKIAKGCSNARQLVGMRILVVEDNLINQQVADELLTAQGAIVSLAANGQLGADAVAAAAPQFDVVLMDVQMPVLDGYGATRVIRNELGLTDLPIVAMTANAMASDRDACIAAGMNEHIGKPFDMGKLVSLLIRMSGLHPLAASSEGPETAPPELPAVPEIEGLELQTALNRMSGMRTLYVRTARDFVRIIDTAIPELQQCLATGDKQKAVMRLHTLKGNAGTLGATELAATAAKFEKLCTTEAGLQECEKGLGRFEILVRSTQKTLNKAIAALESHSPAPHQVVPASTPGQPVSAPAVAALVRIAELARTSDLEALQVFAEARELLVAFPVDSMDVLDEALQSLDLETASSICDRMLLNLNG
jgi:PAS domain S-box-containing protein